MLTLLSKLYGSLTKFRRKLFKPYYKAQVPTICIGNLQVGGTGKTPIVLDLAKFLLEKGLRPFVVLRGYKGKAIGPVLVDKLDSEYFGDEALIYFRHGIDTIVSKNRLAGIDYALNLGAHLIILDDGFQDLRIDYDKKILCFRPFLSKRDYTPFPFGILREDLENSSLADYILITKYNLYKKDIIDKTLKVLEKYNKNIFLVPIKLKNITNFSGEKINLESLKNKEIYLISGLGNNLSFKNFVEKELRLKVKKHIKFPDHYKYKIKDIEKLNNILKEDKKIAFLTTEKDFVKIFDLIKNKDLKLKENIFIVRTYLRIPNKIKEDILNYMKNLERIKKENLNLETVLEVENESYRNCRTYERR